LSSLLAVIAFGVGWHMAELYHVDRVPGETEPEHADSWPDIGRLTSAQRAHLLTLQIQEGIKQLGQGGLVQNERGKIDTEIATSPLRQERLKDAVGSAHFVLLTMLTASDAGVGTAYGLGRALAKTMLVPDIQKASTFVETFDYHRIHTIQEWLANLEAAFPLHAAKAVTLTLNHWVGWAEILAQQNNSTLLPPEQKRAVSQSLRRQGQMWYGLLMGTIEPTHHIAARLSMREQHRP
jgi:hypothetical protein